MSAAKNDTSNEWNWRVYFTQAVLKLGEHDEAENKLSDFTCDPSGQSASATTPSGFKVEVRLAPTDFETLMSYPDWRQLQGSSYRPEYSCSTYYHCTCSQGSTGMRCRHLANLLLHWEKERGGRFVFREDPAVRAERLRRLAEQKELERKLNTMLDVSGYIAEHAFSHAPKNLYFRVDECLKSGFQVSLYDAEKAEKQLVTEGGSRVDVSVRFNRDGIQLLHTNAIVDGQRVIIDISPKEVVNLSCTCGDARIGGYDFWHDKRQPGKMCSHALTAWIQMREQVIRENPGDETDSDGDYLLQMLTGNLAQEKIEEASVESAALQENLTLVPRIIRDKNTNALRLSFDLGRAGSRCYAVKGLESLFKAFENGATYALTKTVSIDFSQETFDADSMRWYQMVASRVRSVQNVNERLSDSYYYTRALSVGTGIPLEESDLDLVYDMSVGGSILYQYSGRNDAITVRVGEGHPRAQVVLEPVKVADRLTGIKISGSMPRLLQGTLHQYILDQEVFGRVSPEEMAALAPFIGIAGGTSAFSGIIGMKRMAEFYYRALPRLQASDQITVIDKVGDLKPGLLPPEPEFTFYLDAEADITCRVEVKYDDVTLPLGVATTANRNTRRDWDQESRVRGVVERFFDHADPEPGCFRTRSDDDTLISIMTDGAATLTQFGEVRVSDALRQVHVRPAPQPKISVGIEGGLLDLTIQTKDLSEDDLLELLNSYRQKKNWYKLKSGDFIDLRNADKLREFDETVQAMDIDMAELIKQGVKLPKYRALYVDRLLEDHNELASSRDKHFKTLVRSFRTIKDSDFEASEKLSAVMRPYQTYGFRWLSTLSASGFGGILADEMGLGKTLQMLSFIQTQHEGGEQRPALVVCPASLVFNWKEECRRFTPDLRVETLAGTLPQRKAQLKQMATDEHADLYVTSYDLLKRDIALYNGLQFSTAVLDEAQYIKNHTTAVSKATRVLNAEHRFALTGTPIENRLSELWSIFDFLMPGFLYTNAEFGRRFETPIMKRKDAAMTAQLSRMTEPFILRRKKQDVLKDLPEKLEETRTAEMEPDQRQLYDAQVVHMRELLNASDDSGEDKMRILAEITRLRQLCCDPSLLFENYAGSSAKRAACLELVQNAIDGGHRMLLFSQFTSMLSLLADDLKAAGIEFFTITGATSKQERLRLVNEFNNGTVPVFLISLKAGGTGLNLTGADVVIHYDPWWNLAVQNQATDRAHRIGQTKQVTVIKLIAAETIEERIVELQQTKRDLAEAIISGQNTSLMSLSREELLALLG